MSEEVKYGVDTLAPIDLETRSAEYLLKMWYETGMMFGAKGLSKPERGMTCESLPGIDARVYFWIESLFESYRKDKPRLSDLNLRELALHWIGKDHEPVHLVNDMPTAQGIDKMLRWCGTDRRGFVAKMIAEFSNYVDEKRFEKKSL